MAVKKNKVLEKMRRGQKAYGCTLQFPSTDIVELLGFAGLDYVLFDAEHGPFTPESIDILTRTADLVGLTPTARVHSHDAPSINRFLDRGIMGIMAPHVNTAAEARAIVNGVRFGPVGQRSWGGNRGTDWNVQTDEQKQAFVREVNANMLLMIQLESAEAIQNVDSILKAEGVDLYTYGPNDLAQSMGFPGQPGHPKVVDTMRRTTERIHAAGKQLCEDLMLEISATNVIMDATKELLKQK